MNNTSTNQPSIVGNRDYYIAKSFNFADPAKDLFHDNRLDVLIQRHRKYTSILSGEWSREYATDKPFFTAVEARKEMGQSYQTSIGQRNARGTTINENSGGVTPRTAAGAPVELTILQRHFTVMPEEVHGRKDIAYHQGIQLNPTSNYIANMASIVSSRLAENLDSMQEETDFQAACTIARGYVPSMGNKDEMIIDYTDLYGAQVGEYNIPKLSKRNLGVIAPLLAAHRVLSREVRAYSSQARYMLLCNREFLDELMQDEKLNNYWMHQPMNREINPLYTGNFLSHFCSIPVGTSGVIDIVEDCIDFEYFKRGATGVVESVSETALPRLKVAAAVTNMAKLADPKARLIAIVPNQFLMVKGVVHGREGSNLFRRVTVESAMTNSVTRVVIEQAYLPVYLLPQLAMDITIATGDDVTGVGKTKKLPTEYQAKA